MSATAEILREQHAPERGGELDDDAGVGGLHGLVVRFTEAIGADTAALLTAIDGGPVDRNVLKIEALAVRRESSRLEAAVEIRGLASEPFILPWVDRSLLGRALAGAGAIVERVPGPDQLVVTAPIRAAGGRFGALYASFFSPSEELDRPALGRTAENYASRAALRLIRRT